jgi:uncharacterized protein involved in response to NO
LLVLRERLAARPAPKGFALWQLGLRPFYLLAAIFAAGSIAVWAMQYAGWLRAAYLQGPLWHAHEMLFGFTLAVVTGFLFTAVRNWTQRPTPTGITLAAIVALWLAARVLVLTPYHVPAMIANVAFPLVVAGAIAVPLAASGNRRNYFFVALLIAVACADLAFHLAQSGRVSLPPDRAIHAGLDVVLFLVTVMGGRVIPMFTNNGVPGCNATRHPAIERIVLGTTLAVLALDAAAVQGAIVDFVVLACAFAHATRLALWQPWRTLRVPLVWILHAAYAWIPVHLLLRVLADVGVVPGVLATHALTVGVLGAITLGMMVRTARGHTGRPLRADRAETAAFVLIVLAAVLRVFGALIVPSAYVETVVASAAAWCLAFAIYVVRYAPILVRPRVDGKPG